MTTMDRDIRFTPGEIVETQRALRAAIKKLNRSIEKAESNRRDGAVIQHGTLDSHYKNRETLEQVLANLEVARKAIARRIADALDATSNVGA